MVVVLDFRARCSVKDKDGLEAHDRKLNTVSFDPGAEHVRFCAVDVCVFGCD